MNSPPIRPFYSLMVVLLFIFPSVLWGFPGPGFGTINQPYEISDWYQLDAVRNDLQANYILVNHLDQQSDGYDDLAGSGADNGNGWQPVGVTGAGFEGRFNGQGYSITGVYLNRDQSDNQGLFGVVEQSAEIINVELLDVEFYGRDQLGALVGWLDGLVINSRSTGEIYGDGIAVGGLVGRNEQGTVEFSGSSVRVEGDESVGGLVGYNYNGLIFASFATGDVFANGPHTGGLSGYNFSGLISNCYATGDVTGSLGGGTWVDNHGGLLGHNFDGTVEKSFATGKVSGAGGLGGLVGTVSGGEVNYSFWDIESSEIQQSAGGIGKTTAEMKALSTFADSGWTIEVTDIDVNDGYPYHSGETDPVWFIRDTDLLVQLEIDLQGAGEVYYDGNLYQQPLTMVLGDTVHLAAVPEANWQFRRWDGDLSSTDTTVELLVDQNMQLQAIFEHDTQLLDISVVGDGQVHYNGNLYSQPVDILTGETVLLEVIPDNIWYFAGWQGDITGTDTAVEILADRDWNISALFEEHESRILDITISGAGTVLVNGDSYSAPLPVIKDDTVVLQAQPESFWYFQGWGGELSGTSTVQTITMDEDRSVTADFSQETHTVTVDLAGDGTVTVNDSSYTQPLVFVAGSELDFTARPGPVSYFSEWTGDLAGFDTEISTIVTQDLSITAEFLDHDTNLLTINYSGEGQFWVDGQLYQQPVSLVSGETVEVQAEPAPHWEFIEWTGDLSGTSPVEMLFIDADKTVTALFDQLDTFLLTAQIDGPGQLLVDGDSYLEPLVYDDGTTVALIARPDELAYFVGWAGDLTGTDKQQELIIDQDKELYLVFQQHETRLLTINFEGSGEVLVDGQLYQQPVPVIKNQFVQLDPVPDQYWQFEKWSDDLAGGDSPGIVVLSSDRSVTAHFQPDRFSVNLEIQGKGKVYLDGEKYQEPVLRDAGELVELMAKPDDLWKFNGWSGDISVADSQTFIYLSDHRQLTADFTPRDTNLLSIDFDGTGQIYLNDQPYTEPTSLLTGETVTVKAVAGEFSRFDSWTGHITGETETLQLFMDSDKQLVASFIDLPTRQLNISILGDGYVLVDGKVRAFPATVLAGETVSLEAVKVDSTLPFRKWEGALTGQGTQRFIYVDANKNITAVFERGGPGLTELSVGPNPFRPSDGTSSTGTEADGIQFHFNSLEDGPFEVKIYTITGRLVFDTITDDRRFKWDGRNNSGTTVTTGYYLYHVVERSTGDSKTGRLAILRWE